MLADRFFAPASRTSAWRRSRLGSEWVFHLHKKLKKSFGQTPFMYGEDPVETLRRHVWVSPYYEDDLAALRELVGADRDPDGPDWPHAEGLANPTDYIFDLRRAGYSDDEPRRSCAPTASSWPSASRRRRVAQGARRALDLGPFWSP